MVFLSCIANSHACICLGVWLYRPIHTQEKKHHRTILKCLWSPIMKKVFLSGIWNDQLKKMALSWILRRYVVISLKTLMFLYEDQSMTTKKTHKRTHKDPARLDQSSHAKLLAGEAPRLEPPHPVAGGWNVSVVCSAEGRFAALEGG